MAINDRLGAAGTDLSQLPQGALKALGGSGKLVQRELPHKTMIVLWVLWVALRHSTQPLTSPIG